MVDGSTPFNAEKAYKDRQKLCQTCSSPRYQRRMESAGQDLPVIAGARLVIRPYQRGGFWRLQPPVQRARPALVCPGGPSILRISERVETAGSLLAPLATDDAYATPGLSATTATACWPQVAHSLRGATAIAPKPKKRRLALQLWETEHAAGAY